MKRITIDRKNQNSKKVKTGLLFIPVSITPLIDTEDACFALNAACLLTIHKPVPE